MTESLPEHLIAFSEALDTVHEQVFKVCRDVLRTKPGLAPSLVRSAAISSAKLPSALDGILASRPRAPAAAMEVGERPKLLTPRR